MMYVFEYLVYHLKPFGISTNLMVPLNQSRSFSSSYANQAGQSQALNQKDKSAVDKDSKTPSSVMKDSPKESVLIKTKVPILPEDSDMQKREELKIYRKSNRKANEVLSEKWNSKSNENHANDAQHESQTLKDGINKVLTKGKFRSKRSTPLPSLHSNRVKSNKLVLEADKTR